MKFTTAKFSEFDTPAETARKLNAMLIQLQARLDVDAVRVGDTTKLDYNGDVTCADVTCGAVDAESVDTEAFTMATDAVNGYVLGGDADGVASWVSAGAAGAGGATTNVQYNTGGALDGEAAFTYTAGTDTLVVPNVDADAIDAAAITMATGAGADKVLTSDGAGVASWTAPAVQVAGNDTEVQFNDGGAFAGDATFTFNKTTDVLSLDHLDMDGTETDELIDIDRVIDANVTKGAVTVTESRTGAVSADSHGGFEYDGTVSATSVDHFGFKSTISIPGATAVTRPICFSGVVDSNSAGTPPTGAVVFYGRLALDNIATPAMATANSAFIAYTAGSRSGELHGLYTKASNWGSGKAIGFMAYGISAGATSAVRGIGVRAVGQCTNGVAVGVFAEPAALTANGLAVLGKGHSIFYNGNVYVRNTTSDPTVPAVADKTHVTEAENGSLWVENQMEVDGVLYADGGAVVTGDLTVTGEFKGGRCVIDAAVNTSAISASRYLCANNGLPMTAERGYSYSRPGKIIGVTGCVTVTSSSGGECYIDIKVGGSTVASTTALACDDHIGNYITWSQAVARVSGAAFSAEDVISFYIRIVGTATVGYPIGTAELQFDT